MRILNPGLLRSRAAGGEIEVNALSVCGPVRDENQDAAAAWRGKRGEAVLIIADGMGGHSSGRQAAEIVVRVALDTLRQGPGRGCADWEAVLRRAFAAAQEAVHAAAKGPAHQAGGTSGMGATAVMAVVAGSGVGSSSDGQLLHVAHAGDSRAYLYRGRSLIRLTTDHSMVEQMVRDGLLREDEAFGHPDSNVIQRAIGQDAPLEPEVQPPVPLDAGDLVLLSTDGLHGVVHDAEIAAVVESSGSTVEICRNLLQAALAAASQDNITIGCMRPSVGGTRRRTTRIEAAPPVPEGEVP